MNKKICPRCSSELKERVNKSTGEFFLGCTSYPVCKYSESITVDEHEIKEKIKYLKTIHNDIGMDGGEDYSEEGDCLGVGAWEHPSDPFEGLL